ncbi:MAG: hypothetical protein IJQ82_01520, partial [Selenomonadaceae bacterium]|nr:hypothetical protein [Selenomonadaceae bacterium]
MANYNKETGRVGAKRYGGTFFEEFLPELRGTNGVQVYQEMSDNDDTIGAVLFAIKMLIRQASWSVQPAGNEKIDVEAAEFVESCLHDMQLTWTDTISEILSFLTYGWSLHEIVYKRRMGRKKDPRLESKFADGLIGWQKLPIRAQESLFEWEFDDNDNLTGFIQMPAPTYETIRIPAEKFLLFRTESRKENPEGRSILRNSYRCFDSETEILTSDGWKFGKDLQGDEELATLNPVTRVIEYEKPQVINRYRHKGQMYHLTSKFLDIFVTGNHRLWVKKNPEGDFDFVNAEDVNSSHAMIRYADWCGEDRTTFSISEY